MPKQIQTISNAGKFNRRAAFQRLSGAPNPLGEQSTWTTYATLWASIDALHAAMVYSSDEFMSKSTYYIMVRYNPAVSIQVSDRIVCQGITFVIEAIVDVGFKHRELQILAHVVNEAG